MSDDRKGALYETLRYEAEELWPKGMEPVPGVEYEATAKRVCDLLRSAADEIERLRAENKDLGEELQRAQADPAYDYGFSNGVRAAETRHE